MTGLLAGKVVVVSGVGPGLGRAICTRMARAGPRSCWPPAPNRA